MPVTRAVRMSRSPILADRAGVFRVQSLPVLAPLAIDEAPEARPEDLGREFLGMRADAFRIEATLFPLEAPDDVADGLGGLFAEVQAGDAVDHGLARAAVLIGQDRRPAGLGLERRDAEILFR